MSDYVIPEIKATEAEMISIRHYLHANPELSLEEFNTSELVASKLTEWGYQVTRGLGKTGVVGSLSKGDSPRTIGLRAADRGNHRFTLGQHGARKNARLRP
ncbi:aminobenzoyl-glutamate utilization protein [Klebsiella pneumoniae]|nr:aminobenzoyl-glutamate utilization protein [Klebsiella pneumoniae]STS65360.1 aminobenzoyl-glutamate utilization protein [Klebsiella pneumoniae]STS69372.1 aminobenzoyl-glutamate utilization protein [Klebsiella pneumoniae]